MENTSIWKIESTGDTYGNLKQAIDSIRAFALENRLNLDGERLVHIKNGSIVSYIRMIVDNGFVFFCDLKRVKSDKPQI